MVGVIGIFLGLAVLIFLAYKGCSVLWVAPVAAMVVALIGGLDLLPAFADTYMTGLVGFVKSWFPMFMLGAIFGKILEVTGCAKSIAKTLSAKIGAKRAVLAIVISTGLMVYGGISLFVVVFAIYPIALDLFREADLPRRLIPGCIACGAFTFAMTAFPGSPQLNNIIPSKYFGTTAMAGPVLGIIAGILMLVLGVLWLERSARKMVANGEHFDEPKNGVAEDNLPDVNFVLALLPLIVVVLMLNLLTAFAGFESDVRSTYSIIIALLCGIILAILINIKNSKGMLKAISEGAQASISATLNTSAAVGFGTVVKAVPGFAVLTNAILGIKASPLISESLAVTLLAGATGSSSGGLGIALEALGQNYLELANQIGMNLGILHRVAAVASGGLDSLPHCGGIVTMLMVCGMTHKESYKDMGMTTVVIPVFVTVIVVILGSIGIC